MGEILEAGQSMDLDVKRGARADFFSELQNHQISTREFFNHELLDILDRCFGWKNTVIYYFDTSGEFLSSRTLDGLNLSGPDNPYKKFVSSDIVRHAIHRDARRDHLTYFNTSPRLYRSSDVANCVAYDTSAYARFYERVLGARYTLTLAFGIDAYIELMFWRSADEGDFTDAEMEEFEELYSYIASSYKTFKKYEQARIVAELQGDIVASGERAFLVTDDAMHVLSYNKVTEDYLEDLLGPSVIEQLASENSCTWLQFLLGTVSDLSPEAPSTRIIKDYIFTIHRYDRTYSNCIIDRYNWITIRKGTDASNFASAELQNLTTSSGEISFANCDFTTILTRSECRVAELMREGLTYQEIAERLTISFHTVKKHVQNIYSKCGVNNRFQLYKWMEEHE